MIFPPARPCIGTSGNGGTPVFGSGSTMPYELAVVTHVKPVLWINENEPPPPPPPPPPRKGFVVLPRRWVVERTHAWGGRNRRLSKDYEGLASSEEAFICMGMVFLMLKRLS
jgi:hypothetical protein